MDTFEEMKRFVGFDENAEKNLVELAPIFSEHGPEITNGFHDILERFPVTAELIEGRRDTLKAAHNRWIRELFCGEYGWEYFESRRRIGSAHVRIELPPHFVEGVMSYIRSKAFEVILAETTDCREATRLYDSLLKILDLDLLIINSAYRDERIERIFNVCGVSRNLIDNLVRAGNPATPIDDRQPGRS